METNPEENQRINQLSRFTWKISVRMMNVCECDDIVYSIDMINKFILL